MAALTGGHLHAGSRNWHRLGQGLPSAFVRLVRKQHSTGGKTHLLGISKRGNSYLRKLLIHGTRAAVVRMK